MSWGWADPEVLVGGRGRDEQVGGLVDERLVVERHRAGIRVGVPVDKELTGLVDGRARRR